MKLLTKNREKLDNKMTKTIKIVKKVITIIEN